MTTRPLRPLANRDFLAIHDEPLLTSGECELIQSLLVDDAWAPAEITYEDRPGGHVDSRTRSVLAQACPTDESGWPLSAVAEAVVAVNTRLWRYDLTGFIAHDPPSILRYESTVADHFKPHTDVGPFTSTRKLSFSVQLTPSDEYRGGDLVFRDPNRVGLRSQGIMTVFSSLCPHEVTPVMTGRRVALVGWIHGPAFR